MHPPTPTPTPTNTHNRAWIQSKTRLASVLSHRFVLSHVCLAVSYPVRATVSNSFDSYLLNEKWSYHFSVINTFFLSCSWRGHKHYHHYHPYSNRTDTPRASSSSSSSSNPYCTHLLLCHAFSASRTPRLHHHFCFRNTLSELSKTHGRTDGQTNGRTARGKRKLWWSHKLFLDVSGSNLPLPFNSTICTTPWKTLEYLKRSHKVGVHFVLLSLTHGWMG